MLIPKQADTEKKRVACLLVWLTVCGSALQIIAANPAAAAGASGSTAMVSADFDGDGHDDVAIGVPGEDVREVQHGTVFQHVNAGAVNVIYGTDSGLSAPRNQFLEQGGRMGDGFIEGDPELGDNFGHQLAAGDLNGDGFSDLAVSALGEETFINGQSVDDHGTVHVIYGTPSGLSASGDQVWDQNSDGIANRIEENDFFGSSLTVGNFGNGPKDDLAIGISGEDLRAGQQTVPSPGAVQILRGSASGITAEDNLFLTQETPGMRGRAEEFETLGWSLASGDFGASQHDDLAIGAREDFDNDYSTGIEGSVEVVYGSKNGLDASTSELWHQSKPGIQGKAEPTDLFSRALTTGDFNGDSHDDLAVGSEEDIITDEGPAAGRNAGAVNVIFGSPTGLTAANDQLWHQDSTGVDDEAELNDDFGAALTAGDVGGGAEDDLIIGVPLEEFGPGANAGAVHVLFGSATGPTTVGTQFWTQDSSGVLDQSETNDFFGATLTLGGLDADPPLDLVVGAEGEGFEEVIAAGAMSVLYGEVSGPSSTGNQFWHQDSPGIQSRAEDDDQFSRSQSYEYE